ncbi:galactitol-1-phosphate 5-dehydrogenase [Lactovum odontotermitis]
MKALTVTGLEKFDLQEIEVPKVTKGKVRIKVSYVGICGSDLPRYFQGGVHQFPQILGHEFSGVIDKIGPGVENLEPGNRVVAAPLIPCGKCEMCLKGQPALCTHYSFIGSREPGAMADYVVVPAVNCLKIPDSLSMKEAAVLEPLTVAIHGVERVKVHTGATVMVLGAGTIGLLTVLTLNAIGAGKIIVVDLNDYKLEVAKEVGGSVVINPSKMPLEEYFSEHEVPEVVFETAGSSVTQKQALQYVKKFGKTVFIGTSTRDVKLEPELFEKILRGELEITGSWMSYSAPFPGYEWEAGLQFMTKGKIDVRPLLKGIYKLEDKALPFERMIEANTDAIKLMYEINPE